ncbi:hypothetical protein JRO89_XS04G0154100 [Xanthoceras sorbifolium]|uniref:Uncharacterized protein n=1 Tax=Xanthoceras sorbifolium TaxID=99658 RepID=A0ABQ8I5I2_9ROSI|nr:hypothetical protein JRO89_XS04G0154100 [Xanthoceras sorbifolium]
MIKMQGYSDGGGDADLAKIQSTMHTIELACSSIQMHVNPSAAEATILSLCQSPQPYKACQYILGWKDCLQKLSRKILIGEEIPDGLLLMQKMANARFQAAAAIRDAAMREWAFLTADDKRNLVSFCLCFVMQHASSPEGYVLAKVSSVAAQVMKRGW